MNKHFIRYLVEDLNFKPFRKMYNKKGEFEYIQDKINDFSTMQDGGLDIRYIKDNIEIIWGLSEKSKPPTLIYPRPRIIMYTKVKGKSLMKSEKFDDVMNICLKEEKPKDIFEALFNKDLIFRYEKNEEI